MSNFPTAYDSTFPGYPYVDFTENVTAEQANAWIGAIQAIETAIGFGPIGTSANPLYSSAYNTTFSTMAARMSSVETKVVNGLKINSSAANIQPVGTSAVAGSTGLAADAGHVHSGVSPSGLRQIGEYVFWPAAPASYPVAGYLACNGQLISTSTYSTLFSLVGYTYGGSGASFALPNWNDKFGIGINPSGIATAPGATGGSTTITVNQLPAHGHPATDAGHVHQLPPQTAVTTGSTIGLVPTAINQAAFSAIFSTLTGFAQISVGNTGGGAPHTPPYIGVYVLMRCL